MVSDELAAGLGRVEVQACAGREANGGVFKGDSIYNKLQRAHEPGGAAASLRPEASIWEHLRSNDVRVRLQPRDVNAAAAARGPCFWKWGWNYSLCRAVWLVSLCEDGSQSANRGGTGC